MNSTRQINAGVLNVGYLESGPSDGRPVILVHGWPYDIDAFDDATPQLTTSGTTCTGSARRIRQSGYRCRIGYFLVRDSETLVVPFAHSACPHPLLLLLFSIS